MDVGVITTAQVFEALRQQQTGMFDEERWWATVFGSTGVIVLDEPVPAEGRE